MLTAEPVRREWWQGRFTDVRPTDLPALNEALKLGFEESADALPENGYLYVEISIKRCEGSDRIDEVREHIKRHGRPGWQSK